MSSASKCPTCNSPAPHLHPAMQFEGEVQPCRDIWHLTVTPQNTPEKIAKSEAFLLATVGIRCPHCGSLGPNPCACVGDAVGRKS